MLTQVCPKLPMRNKSITQAFYIGRLGFEDNGAADFREYLILKKDQIEIHFFLFEALVPVENHGQAYIPTGAIDTLYQHLIDNGVAIHPNGSLQVKLWGQKGFPLLDPDTNLLTFGQTV